MLKKISWTIISLLIVASIIVGAIYVKNHFFSEKTVEDEQTEVEELPPLEVKGAIADTGDIIKWVECLGRIESRRRVDFISPSNTYIERIHVREGDSVSKGQRLAQLRYGSEISSYEQALFELEKARSRYEYAIENGDSNRSLLRMSSGLVDAERDYTNVSRTIQELNIKAPFDGIISGLSLDEGSSVRQGEIVMSIYSDDGLIAAASVPQTEVTQIEVGNIALITSVNGDRSEEGIVTSVSPVIDERGTGRILVSVSNNWLLGEVVGVEIESEKYENRTRVPTEAILHREDRFLVFAVKEGKAKWVWIEKGAEGRDYIEVIEGISPGDTVLVEGQFTIAHDANVKVIFE